MGIDEEFSDFIKLEELIEKNRILEELLEKCIPFIQFHYERSAVGYGRESKKLLDAINEIIGS